MKKEYYTTKEVLQRVSISRNTLFLWFKYGKIPEVTRDRNGHRLFTQEDMARILEYKNKLVFPVRRNLGQD